MPEVTPLEDQSRTDLQLTAQFVRRITDDERSSYFRYVFGVANGTINPKQPSMVRTCAIIAAQLIRHEDLMIRDQARDAAAKPAQHLHLHGAGGPTAQQLIAAAQQDPEYLEFLRHRGGDEDDVIDIGGDE